ncbi:hypothetical protein FACS189479_05430 [Spirochaetia bacterium]|nr:hypothetical protein FACS189479_05430 [Spirochaetia bacterium]
MKEDIEKKILELCDNSYLIGLRERIAVAMAGNPKIFEHPESVYDLDSFLKSQIEFVVHQSEELAKRLIDDSIRILEEQDE